MVCLIHRGILYGFCYPFFSFNPNLFYKRRTMQRDILSSVFSTSEVSVSISMRTSIRP